MANHLSILVTGGAGYIGSVLIGELLKEGCKVTCIDNLMYGQNSLIQYVSNSNFEFIFGDVRNEELMKRVIPGHNFIIPLAAIVGAPASDFKPSDAITINRDAIVLIDKLRDENQKIICPITNSGYGTKSGEVFCTEESLLEPITLYGRTKVEAEKALLNSQKPAVTLRLATVFGVSPRMRTDLLVNDFVLQAVTNNSIVLFEKDFKRNFVHIRDVASAFLYCIKNFERMIINGKNQAYNFGLDSANMSKLELAKKIKEHIPEFEIYESVHGKDPDKRNYIVSNEKMRRAGFEAKISIDEGIKELIKVYGMILKNNPLENI